MKVPYFTLHSTSQSHACTLFRSKMMLV